MKIEGKAQLFRYLLVEIREDLRQHQHFLPHLKVVWRGVTMLHRGRDVRLGILGVHGLEQLCAWRCVSGA